MRISQLVSNFYTTRPKSIQAINSHVAWLTNGLVGRDHDVHSFASKGSETSATLHAETEALSTLSMSESVSRNHVLFDITKCYEFSQKNCEIVHSHFNLFSSFIGRIASVPTVTSIHSPITEELISRKISRRTIYIFFTSTKKTTP